MGGTIIRSVSFLPASALSERRNGIAARYTSPTFPARLLLVTGILGKFGQTCAFDAQAAVYRSCPVGAARPPCRRTKSKPVKPLLLCFCARASTPAASLACTGGGAVSRKDRRALPWTLEWLSSLLPRMFVSTVRFLAASAADLALHI